MKKFYATLLLSILALAGWQASAQAVDLSATIHVNDPALCTVQQYYYPGGTSLAALEFDAQNEAYIEYPQGTWVNFRSINITPVTPEGSDQVYLKTVTIYDVDGELVSETVLNSTVKKQVKIPAEADGGYIDIDCGTLGNYTLNVNLIGDPAKVKMMFDQTVVSSLAAGAQEVEFAPGTRYLSLYPQGGITQFYKVTYNGTLMSPRADSSEGSAMVYSYLINNPADGASLEIETDYPDVDCNITISCAYPEFVKSITVNGVEQPLNLNFTVKAGDKVAVAGDQFNYRVNGCTINGVATSVASYSMSQVVEADTEFGFDVEFIDRPDRYVAYVAPDTQWLARTSGSQMIFIDPGYEVVPLVSTDNPVRFSLYEYTLDSETARRYVFVNDALIEADAATYPIAVSDGDVIKMYYREEKDRPALHDVSFTFSADPVSVSATLDIIKALDNAQDGFSALPGTQVSFTLPAGFAAEQVTANGAELAPVDGVYTFTVGEAPVEVAITQGATEVLRGDANGDGTVNITDVVMIVNYILSPAEIAPNFVPANADANADGKVNITDTVATVNIILSAE